MTNEEEQPTPQVGYCNVMVDLETLSQKANAAVVSIGANAFWRNDAVVDEADTSAMFYAGVDLDYYDGQPQNGAFHLSGSTVKFWLSQSAEARDILTKGVLQLPDALQQFALWLNAQGGGNTEHVRVWGNGASFDNVILRNAYQAFHVEPPWAWWNDCCYRTLKNVFHSVPKPTINDGVAHYALHDALVQSRHVLAIAQAHSLDLTN